jgi:hypothetical protein
MKAWTGGVLLADKLRAGVSRATAASGSAPKTEEKKDGKKPDKKNLETAPKDDPAVAPKEPVATEKNTSGAVPATASPQAVEATPSVEQKSKVAEPPTVATSHEALNPAATVDAAPAESTATVFKAPAAAAVAITFSKELDVLLVPNRRAEVFKLFAESAKPVPAPAPQQVSAAPIQTAPQQVSAAPIQTAPASAMTSAPAPTPTSTAAQQQQQQPVASHAFHPSQSHYQQSHYQQSHYQQSHHQRQHYARQQQQQPPQYTTTAWHAHHAGQYVDPQWQHPQHQLWQQQWQQHQAASWGQQQHVYTNGMPQGSFPHQQYSAGHQFAPTRGQRQSYQHQQHYQQYAQQGGYPQHFGGTFGTRDVESGGF